MAHNNRFPQIPGNDAYFQQINQKCDSCGGRGKISVIGYKKCDLCHGIGRDFNSDLWAEPCRKCNGKREECTTWSEKCKPCFGTGNRF